MTHLPGGLFQQGSEVWVLFERGSYGWVGGQCRFEMFAGLLII
jgi:hypothetical protein